MSVIDGDRPDDATDDDSSPDDEPPPRWTSFTARSEVNRGK